MRVSSVTHKQVNWRLVKRGPVAYVGALCSAEPEPNRSRLWRKVTCRKCKAARKEYET